MMLPFHLVDCLWTDWGTWSACSPTCSDVVGARMSSRTKVREVDNNGTACEGQDIKQEPCSNDPCPVMEASSHSSYCHATSISLIYYLTLIVNCQWGEWTSSACSETCGDGTQNKTRNITMEGANGGITCNENDATDIGTCNDGPCPGIKVYSYYQNTSISLIYY